MNADSKKCPFCAEVIEAEAKICRFCNRSVMQEIKTILGVVSIPYPSPRPKPPGTAPSNVSKQVGCWIVAAILVGGVLILLIASLMGARRDSSPENPPAARAGE